MKNRTFYATFLLFLFTVYAGIFILSLITLHDTARQAKEQCLNEQYFISSALYSDLAALENRAVHAGAEMETLMQPYLYLTGNRKSLLAVYQNGRLLHTTGTQSELDAVPAQSPAGTRFVTINQKDVRYLCSVSGVLPEPFDSYQVFYQADITDRIEAWKYRNNTMLAAGGIVSLLLALFLLLLLGRLFRPLSKITLLSRKIAAGDYTVRLPDKGRDEIAQMARSFNEMASEIENKITELAAAAENRQRFVDNFAHELRTPLTAIYGYAEYMQKAALNEEDTRFALESILSESRRMQLMANQLMELSNLRRGEIQMEKQSLSCILDSVKCAVKQKLDEKNIRLLISSQVESVTGDTILLQSLLVNLIDNAVKASGAGTAVSVAAFYQEGKPVITVTDQGKGIEPAELTRITEPYYRVDKPRNRREGGAGLGLALCRQIAEKHGAVLSFRSAPGEGTTATVIFTSP